MFRLTSHNIGQVIFEYAIILALIALALGMMQVYLKRGIQSGIKMAADEIGVQEDYKELDPTKRTYQDTLMRRESSAIRDTLQDLSGRHALSLIETGEIIYSQSKYWSGFMEDEN